MNNRIAAISITITLFIVSLFPACERQPKLSPEEELQREFQGSVALGAKDVVADAIKKGAKVNARDEYGNTPLLNSLFMYEQMTPYYKKNNEQAEVQRLREPTHEVVRVLLEAKADQNAANNRGMTPLIYAERMNDEELIKMLIEAGANPHQINRR